MSRKPVDGMIAGVAIEHNIPLLHNDRDFDPMEKFCGLMVVEKM
jgi:predicted nucleic acid-binding protein